MLKIRLQRVGRKHEPTFRVVLTDSKNSPKSGRFLDVLGSYDPRKKGEVFNGDKIKHWMSHGAQLSDTLRNLLITHKVIEGKKKNVLPKKSPVVDEEKLAQEKAAAEEALRKAEEEKKAKEEADKLAQAEEEKKEEASPEVLEEGAETVETPEVKTEEATS